MFDKALIYRAGLKDRVDIGLFAETLFFYGKTHLLLDRGSLQALVKIMPQDVLLELFDADVLQLSFIRQSFVVLTAGVPKAHDFGVMQVAGTADGKKITNFQEDIVYALEHEFGRSRGTTKFAQKIADRASLHRFRGIPEKEKVIPDLVRSDIEDQNFVQEAVKAVLLHLVPDFDQHKFRFRIFQSGNGNYFVDTDLDFGKMDPSYQSITPGAGPISIADLLGQLQEARADTFFAAYYMAEPVTGQLSSDIMRLKHFEFLRRRNANAEDLELFHELIVPGIPTIREAINSGERSIVDLMKFLDQAKKFKDWLVKANPDIGLIQSYYKDVTQKSWIETLPGKVLRFVVAGSAAFAATSTLGPAAGLGVGATNTFLLDRVLKGWRPNRFVDGKYKKFVLPKN